MEDTVDFRRINEARKTLGLGESATLEEIKKSYRELVKKYHPDKYSKVKKKRSEKQMKEVNEAYEFIMEYCGSYRYSFTEKEVEDFYTKYMKGFQEDWMWGPGKRGDKKEEKKNDYRGI
ncbi:MAG: DnaJ domain-containing protein [Candidatus Altiarchaeota archaeon]|nr:DnaJ domain-containing protein [Candidatus Altiarchaeota archaeon]